MATANAVNVTDAPLTVDGEGHVLAGGERGPVDTSLPSVHAAVLRGALLVDPRVEKRIRSLADGEPDTDPDVDEDTSAPAAVVVDPAPAPRSSRPRRAAAQPAETAPTPAGPTEPVPDPAPAAAAATTTTDEVSA